jgi:riboflavin synthase
MFTGIVETVGTIRDIQRRGDLVRIRVEAPEVAREVGLGQSISVDGACLTVTEFDQTSFCFDAVPETLERTSLGGLAAESKVNLERAMRLDARFDGHIVQGHVDEAGRVRELRREGDDARLFVACTEEFSDLLVEKGSVAIAGVSLTVVGVEAAGFDVALIPHTLEVTTLGALMPGDRVNLEADVLGKYVKRYLERVVGRDASRSASQ